MGWTKEQEEAMNLRNSNLLVSAAAGSGKTAVLVERIVKMVCEEDYAIDKILVVTFTKVAAAEMKERIGTRILEEGIKNPDNQKIQEQLAYIHKAPISTIHSFCMDILRNHFHLIALDPNFRIGEEGEAALLKEQVLDEMMEECYEEKNEEFLRLIEAYSYGKDDRTVCDMILRLLISPGAIPILTSGFLMPVMPLIRQNKSRNGLHRSWIIVNGFWETLFLIQKML